MLRMIREILMADPPPGKTGTSVAAACDFLIRTLRRKALVFMISDFFDDPLEKPLGKLGRKHEMIALQISDPLEMSLPKAGKVVIIDPETGLRSPGQYQQRQPPHGLREADAAAVRRTSADLQKARDRPRPAFHRSRPSARLAPLAQKTREEAHPLTDGRTDRRYLRAAGSGPGGALAARSRPALWAWGLVGLGVLALIAALIVSAAQAEAARPGESGIGARGSLPAGHGRAARRRRSKPSEEAATAVSITLRRYLAVASGDPALFETHEEFVARHQSLASYPEDLRSSTAEGFSHLARLKYGREATGDPVALYSAARQLLERLHQHRPA